MAVVIYTKPGCPYCQATKALLAKKEISFKDIDVSANPAERPEMIKRAGGRTTVPQIFIGDRHIGGNDDLQALERKGELDALLAQDSGMR